MAQKIVAVSSAGAVSRSPDFPASTDVAAAVAVLVADAASPTEAHVTDLNDAWTPFLASETLSRAGQLSISYDSTMTLNQIKASVKEALVMIEGTM